MSKHQNASVVSLRSNRYTKTEFRRRRHRRCDHISMWTAPEPYESVLRNEHVSPRFEVTTCTYFPRGNHSSSLRVYRSQDRWSAHGSLRRARKWAKAREWKKRNQRGRTKTFFSLISRWTRPRPWRYLKPSTTSKAIRILRRDKGYIERRETALLVYYRIGKSSRCFNAT